MQSNKFILHAGFQQREGLRIETECTFINFVQLAHRGREKKKKGKEVSICLLSKLYRKDRKARCQRWVLQKLKQKIDVKTEIFLTTPAIEPRSSVCVDEHSISTPPPRPQRKIFPLEALRSVRLFSSKVINLKNGEEIKITIFWPKTMVIVAYSKAGVVFFLH